MRSDADLSNPSREKNRVGRDSLRLDLTLILKNIEGRDLIQSDRYPNPTKEQDGEGEAPTGLFLAVVTAERGKDSTPVTLACEKTSRAAVVVVAFPSHGLGFRAPTRSRLTAARSPSGECAHRREGPRRRHFFLLWSGRHGRLQALSHRWVWQEREGEGEKGRKEGEGQGLSPSALCPHRR